nr:unnamed protein product [Callosobruchus chinensis]
MLSFRELIILLCLFLHAVICDIGLRCDMIPEGVVAPRYKQDLGRYKIEVSGNPDAYVPGEQYTGGYLITDD